jgi:hypothetical protein
VDAGGVKLALSGVVGMLALTGGGPFVIAGMALLCVIFIWSLISLRRPQLLALTPTRVVLVFPVGAVEVPWQAGVDAEIYPIPIIQASVDRVGGIAADPAAAVWTRRPHGRSTERSPLDVCGKHRRRLVRRRGGRRRRRDWPLRRRPGDSSPGRASAGARPPAPRARRGQVSRPARWARAGGGVIKIPLFERCFFAPRYSGSL